MQKRISHYSEDLSRFDNLKELQDIIAKYRDTLSGIDDGMEILNAYLLKKPMTSLEIYDQPAEVVEAFLRAITSFFHVIAFFFRTGKQISFDSPLSEQFESQGGKVNINCFISRFQSIIEILDDLGELDDNTADLYGILCGISLDEVFKYCERRNPELIK